MKCPSCGADNPNQASFCKKCGTKLVKNPITLDVKEEPKDTITTNVREEPTYEDISNVVVEEPTYEYNSTQSAPNTSSGNDNSFGYLAACCCIAIVILYLWGMTL